MRCIKEDRKGLGVQEWFVNRWTSFKSFSKRIMKLLHQEDVENVQCKREHINFYRLRIFAVIQVLLPLSAFSFCYAIGQAQSSSKVKPFPHIPFISSVISYQPQSGIATLIVDFAAFMMGTLVIARYLQIKAYDRPELYRKNKVALGFGIAASFSLLWVPAFDVLIQFEIHFVGTTVFFISTSTYFALYTYLAKAIAMPGQKLLPNIQIALTILLWISVIITAVFLLPPFHKYNEAGLSVGPIAEWTWFSIIALFSCTMVADFKNVRLTITVQSFPNIPEIKEDTSIDVLDNYDGVIRQNSSHSTTTTTVDIDDTAFLDAHFTV